MDKMRETLIKMITTEEEIIANTTSSKEDKKTATTLISYLKGKYGSILSEQRRECSTD